MRATIFTFIVLYVAAVMAIPQFGGFGGLRDYPQERWATLEGQIRSILLSLEKEKGEKLTLAKINTVRSQTVAGFRYEINADWTNADGVTVTCDSEYIDGIGKQLINVNCPEKTYSV